MEKIAAIIPSAMTNLNKSLQTTSNSLSVYKDNLTQETIVECNLIIRQAFPTLTQGFFIQLNRLIAENSFTDTRLREATDHVITTCIYPQPTIANFLSYDTRIKLYSYKEIVEMCQPGYEAFEYFELVGDKYASKNDVEKYGLRN